MSCVPIQELDPLEDSVDVVYGGTSDASTVGQLDVLTFMSYLDFFFSLAC